MQYVNSNDIPWSKGDHGVRYVMRGPNTEWGILRLKPGQSSADYGQHIHERVEETFYFMEGSPRFVIGGVEHQVKPGDAYRVDPGETHNLINDTDENVVAVFIKWPFDPSDRIPVE